MTNNPYCSCMLLSHASCLPTAAPTRHVLRKGVLVLVVVHVVHVGGPHLRAGGLVGPLQPPSRHLGHLGTDVLQDHKWEVSTGLWCILLNCIQIVTPRN